MDEIISNHLNDTPVVTVNCPNCRERIHHPYGLKYGSKFQCEGCSQWILATFYIEAVPP